MNIISHYYLKWEIHNYINIKILRSSNNCISTHGLRVSIRYIKWIFSHVFCKPYKDGQWEQIRQAMIPVICIAGGQMEVPSFFTYPPVGKQFETSRASSAALAAGDENRLESTQGRDSRRPRDGWGLRKSHHEKMPHPGQIINKVHRLMEHNVLVREKRKVWRVQKTHDGGLGAAAIWGKRETFGGHKRWMQMFETTSLSGKEEKASCHTPT